MDTVDASTRSRIMSRVGQRNTEPELLLRRALHSHGLRYRLHDKRLPGSPDLVFPRFRAAMFVHGCFWHAHRGCKFASVPTTRPEFWASKLEANRARDRRSVAELRRSGWRVLVVWGCSLKSRSPVAIELAAARAEEWLRSAEPSAELAPGPEGEPFLTKGFADSTTEEST